MKKTALLLLFFLCALHVPASVGLKTMQAIYEEVKTPYKYGLVVAPQDAQHQIDCPMIYRVGDQWLMTYIVYNGSDGLNGRGYETWLATSDDLLHWHTSGRLLAYTDKGWDMNQKAGYPALIDWTWGGSYKMKSYGRRYWMSYFGGTGTGYEAVRAPLSIGIASTKGDITKAHLWHTGRHPVLSSSDASAQWWEKLTQYKSTIYEDDRKTLGHRFVMFYNAGGINPSNQLKAERIGIAVSDDMRSWTRLPLRDSQHDEGNPVFAHEVPGMITGDAQIVRMPKGFGTSDAAKPLYVMFYFSAYSPRKPYKAYNTFAVSDDLLQWQDWQGPDLIVPGKPYDNLFAHKSYVLKHDGIVYHFYCAVNKAGQRGIAVATSVPMGKSAVSFPVPPQKGPRREKSLNDNWTVTFVRTTMDSITSRLGALRVTLPNNLDDYYGYRQLRHGNLHGSATYTRTFNCRKDEDKLYFLQFEGVGTYATVTLNGHTYPRQLVGRTCYTLNITDALIDGNNHLSVLVDHPAYQTASPWVCGGCSSESGFSEGSQPFGIFRPLTLISTAKTRIAPFGVHIWNNAACDSVFIETEIKNYDHQPHAIQLVSKLNDSDGKALFRLPVDTVVAANASIVVRQQTAVRNPHRWNLTDSYLYALASLVKEQGKTIDAVTTDYGIRSISWPVHRNDSTGYFLLNDKKVFINGTCDYEHLFGGSHAFTHEQIASRVKMMREAGFNAFREAHQPHNLYWQHLFDEQGMLFWSQYSAHIWYDTPAFRNNFKQLLRQWIKERRNSPSIILWGLQNESVLPHDFTKECADIIRAMDPTCKDQRAITTCNGGEGTDWNVVQNWSGTYGGNPDNYANELKQPSELLNGEYGAWRTLGLHYTDVQRPAKKDYSEEGAARLLLKKAKLAQHVKDSVCGHFQWIFVSHENPGRTQPDEALRRIDKVGPFNYKGLLSPWEQPTVAFFAYKQAFGKDSLLTKAAPTPAYRNSRLLKPAEGWHYLYRVNCGGDAYTDTYGQQWEQDDTLYSHSWAQRFRLTPFLASQGHITDNIKGTDDDSLFQYFRWGRHELYYHFPLPDGDYRVELYFAEPWLGLDTLSAADHEDERLFDVAFNDSTVLKNVDIWAEGGYAGAVKKVVNAHVRGGRLVISFPQVKAGEAVISAIAIASKNKMAVPRLKTHLPLAYWRQLDNDTIIRYPKALLPNDNVLLPAIRYKETKSHQWTVRPGIAREYALHFRYKNTLPKPVVAQMTITDSQGTVLRQAPVTFPATPKKYKMVSTTTGTQINAGSYLIRLDKADGLTFDYLEMQ